jgi:hypothetical protein
MSPDQLITFAGRLPIGTAPDEHEIWTFSACAACLSSRCWSSWRAKDRPSLALLFAHIPKLAKEAEGSAEAYRREKLPPEFRHGCRNWLLFTFLHSISLRTLRYVRLGYVAAPQSVRISLKHLRTKERRDQAGPQATAFPRSRAAGRYHGCCHSRPRCKTGRRPACPCTEGSAARSSDSESLPACLRTVESRLLGRCMRPSI